MEANLCQVKFGSHIIDFSLSYTKRKSLGIQVTPESNVNVIAPINAKQKEVFKKVKAKGAWIIKQKRFFKSYQPKTPRRKFVNGETHLYLGRQYKLKIIKNKEEEVKIYRGIIQIYSKQNNPEYLKSLLELWYKEKAKEHFYEVLEQAAIKFKKYKISEPLLYIRKMEKRWGSCTPTGKVILNLELIKAPKGSIEYVMIHELCHLVHRNHNKAFFDLQNKMLPDWEKWKERLERVLA
jgi:predicted metal-dependent hydrolase